MPLGRNGERILHLPENLRFAYDQRVETGGNAEQVTGCVCIGPHVQVRDKSGFRHIVKRGQERDQRFSQAFRIFTHRVDLGTVARRQHDDL